MLRFKQMYLYYVIILRTTCRIIKTVGQCWKTKGKRDEKMLEDKYRGTIGESARIMKNEKKQLR